MNKLSAFVRLDFITIKPYFTAKNMLIYTAVALFLTTMSGTVVSGIGIGMMLGTLFIGYPFAIGEKSNMDAFYVTLSVNRRTVVLGRYVFTILLNVCIILYVFVVASAGLVIARIADFGNEAGDALWIVVLLAAFFSVIQAIQLPFFFKYGYTKARFLTIVPFVAIMAGYIAFTSIIRGIDINNQVIGFFDTLHGGAVIVCAVLALVLAIFVSYSLSVSFYKKREF